MKILWITNILFPSAQAYLSGSATHKGSGGWMLGAASALTSAYSNIELYVACVSDQVKALTSFKVDQITYYILPYGKGNIRYNKEYEPLWQQVKEDVQPDVVHIHGSEYSHGLAYVKACGNKNVVVSIQGVMQEIAKHYRDGLSDWDILSHITLHDLTRGGICSQQRKSKIRAKSEPQLLSLVQYVIGRTEFDREYTKEVCPDAKYFHCNESLRDEFYSGEWKYEKCMPHTIFLSQAAYPLKGLHMVLKAIPSILNRYPKLQIRIAGDDKKRDSSLREFLAIDGYTRIIHHYISQFGLSKHITYTGMLSAEEMKKELLRANLFICPSSCENSSNSIAEAQMLGIPVLASNRGGNPSMIPNEKCGVLYSFDDLLEMSALICAAFEKSNVWDNSEMRALAHERHAKEKNVQTLISIYEFIISTPAH